MQQDLRRAGAGLQVTHTGTINGGEPLFHNRGRVQWKILRGPGIHDAFFRRQTTFPDAAESM
jgi:hypothetical protein